MKTLYALRHAKSSWSDPTLADFDRPLSRRGIKAARNIARVLDEIDPQPELALCSTAVRAVQTYEVIAKHLSYSISASLLDNLYGAGPITLLDTLRAVPARIGSVLLVGHNPGMQELLIALTENDDRDEARHVRMRFPTAALAVVRIRGEWANLGAEQTTLTNLVLPRTLESP